MEKFGGIPPRRHGNAVGSDNAVVWDVSYDNGGRAENAPDAPLVPQLVAISALQRTRITSQSGSSGSIELYPVSYGSIRI